MTADQHTRQTIEEELVLWWSELLHLPKVGIHEDFFQIGGNQVLGASMLQRVKQHYKVAIPTLDLYEARTVGKLADLIQMKQSSREQLCIVPIRVEGNRLPLFLLHGVGGNILGFAGLARMLHADQPVYGIQAQALQSGGPTLIKLEDMAKFYLKELRMQQPRGPYALLGFSFGGLVAYEMAQQLTAIGEQVYFLGMLDTWQPGYMKHLQAGHSWLKRAFARLNLVRLNTKKLSPRQLLPYIYIRLRSRFFRLAYARAGSTQAVSLPEAMHRVRDINLIAGEHYKVRPYPGKVTLFRAKDEASNPLPEDLAWRSFAIGGLEIIKLPGDHGQILAEPNLSFMASSLETHLALSAMRSADTAGDREEFELDEDSLIRVTSHAESTGVPK